MREGQVAAKVTLTDVLGRDYSDDLTQFLFKWWKFGEAMPVCPALDAQHFVEGITGLVLLRERQFQVQLFIAGPDVVIPSHTHPNVDSYEIFLRGMEFTYHHKILTPLEDAERALRGVPYARGRILRVKPNDPHGGRASSTGGAFLSIQQWAEGHPPSSVGNDWDGKTMGDSHSRQAGKNV